MTEDIEFSRKERRIYTMLGTTELPRLLAASLEAGHTHYISPTYAVQKNLAPAFIVTAGYDLLHDEGQIYAYKLRHHGIAVHYQDYQDQSHGFANLTIVSGQAKKYLMEISKNYRKFWDRQR